jgi:hypothetical protein
MVRILPRPRFYPLPFGKTAAFRNEVFPFFLEGIALAAGNERV